MSELQTLLPSLRVKIAAARGKRTMNEQTTKATLIVPVLRALGWDPEEPDSVVHEYRPRRSDNPVDYALLVSGDPRLFIEAKALGENLDDRKWAIQIMSYAGAAGVEWIGLTNGDEWRLYNAHATVAVEEKLFRTVRISSEDTLAQDTLALLAKEQWDGKRIELLWQAQFVDRKVRVAVETMFGADTDGGLVHAIHKRCRGLTSKEIKASLGRARITLDFPRVVEPTPGGTKKPLVTRPGRPFPETSGVTQHDLIKAGIIKAPLALERTYKGQTLKATLKLNGRVMHAGEAFDSLSAAGGRARQSVSGSAHPLATNGWSFWCYKDQSGKLVPADELRQQYLKSRTRP